MAGRVQRTGSMAAPREQPAHEPTPSLVPSERQKVEERQALSAEAVAETLRLEGRNDRFDVTGWMEIATELSADGFHYRVIDEGGSEMIRHRVFRGQPARAGQRGGPAVALIGVAIGVAARSRQRMTDSQLIERHWKYLLSSA